VGQGQNFFAGGGGLQECHKKKKDGFLEKDGGSFLDIDTTPREIEDGRKKFRYLQKVLQKGKLRGERFNQSVTTLERKTLEKKGKLGDFK